MKHVHLAAFFCGVALGLAACADHSATSLPPGKYSSSKSTIDANGTLHEIDTTTNVTVDAYGNKTAVIDNTNVTDPPGLFNKSTTKTRKVETDDSY